MKILMQKVMMIKQNSTPMNLPNNDHPSHQDGQLEFLQHNALDVLSRPV
jgi:hypothetical protein